MHYYYSIYRKEYLYKGIVLYESMKLHDRDFRFFLFCMEEESAALLKQMNFINLIPISIKAVEDYDKRIPELKSQRGEKTYIWTAKASAALYLFDKFSEMDHVIWLDGDTEFLSDPEAIYQEWGDHSVLLTEEKFSGEFEYIGHLVGFYNTGFMGFRRDETGISCLKYFRERLQEWKNTIEEQSSWNDQLYVDDWPERFSNIGVSRHDGINLTPFIASRINKEQNGYVNIMEGKTYIKDTPIVLYHFMALKYFDGNEFDLCSYWMKFDKETIKKLYIPYLKKCNEAYERIREVAPYFYPKQSIEGSYISNYFNLDVNTSQPEYHICTISKKNQLLQTLTLYQSISRYRLKFRLWICCEDKHSYHTLKQLKLPGMQLFELSNVIEDYHRLTQSTNDIDTQIIKPRFINMLLQNNCSLEGLLYVDCGCYFHQNPKYVFDLLGKDSLLLFSGAMHQQKSGISGFLMGFCRNQATLNCVYYWVQKTKEWVENGVGSQDEVSYIGGWEDTYSQVRVIRDQFYVMEDEKLAAARIKKKNECFFINNEALVIYKYCLDSFDESSLDSFMKELFSYAPISKKQIYLPYMKAIRSSLGLLHKSQYVLEASDR